MARERRKDRVGRGMAVLAGLGEGWQGKEMK